MTIPGIIAARDITEVVHYTTNNGLVGIIRQQVLKARAFLKEDETLKHILKLNTEKVFDRDWKEYVNLSISRINPHLFGYSLRTHSGYKWRLLSFRPEIMTHDGVLFTTTNNAYFQHLERGAGVTGLEALFAAKIKGIFGKVIERPEDLISNQTTDVQAEVLYPKEVPLSYLQCIYVRTEEEADSVCGKFSTFGFEPVPVIVSPERFH